MGGRYCSIMMVESGNAFVFERISAKIATAVMNGMPKNQPPSPLAMSRRGVGDVPSTIDPG